MCTATVCPSIHTTRTRSNRGLIEAKLRRAFSPVVNDKTDKLRRVDVAVECIGGPGTRRDNKPRRAAREDQRDDDDDDDD